MTKEQWVVKNISDYLEMDLNFFLKNTDAIIYGGAVRDTLAFMPIQDVDVALLPVSLEVITELLLSKGWEEASHMSDLSELLGGGMKKYE